MLEYIAIAIFSIIFLILALRRLDWAALVLITALPTYIVRFQLFNLPLTLLEIMILIVFATWFFKFFIPILKGSTFNLSQWQAYPFRYEIILLLIISLFTAGVAGFSPSALGLWKAYFFEPILLYIVIINLFNNKRGVHKIISALALSAMLVALFAIVQQLSGLFISNPYWAATETRRAVSFFGYPNAVGLYLAPIAMLLGAWFLSIKGDNDHQANFKKIVIILTIILSVLAIYFAHSEGALAALLISAFICAVLIGRRARITALILVVLGIITLTALPTTRATIFKKAALRDLSGEIRRQQWRETANMLKDHRLLSGAGLGAYQKTIAPFHQDGIFYNFDNRPNFDAVVWASSSLQKIYWQPVEIYLYPHNILLNFWSELGIVGLIVFFCLIIRQLSINLKLVTILDSKNNERYLALGLSGAMFTIIIHGLVDVPYFKNDLAVLFWIIIALTGIMTLENKNKLINKT